MAVSKGPKVDLDDLVRRWEADKKSRLFLQLAEEYRKQDSIDAALSVLREGLKHHATFQPARVALARCLLAKGQLAQAQAELDPIVKKAPDNLLAAKLLAEVLQARGERQKALQVLQRVAPFAPDDPEVAERISVLQAVVAPPTPIGGSATDTAEFSTGEFQSDTTAGTTQVPVRGAARPAVPAAPPARPAPPAGAPPPLAAAARTPPPPADDLLGPPLRGVPDEDVLDVDADALVLDVDIDDADEVAAPSRMPPAPPRPQDALPEEILGPPRSASPPPDDEFTSLTLAELYESQGAHAEAAAIYARLLERKPQDAELRRSLERSRARSEGRAVPAASLDAAPAPAPARPRWAPVRPRSSEGGEDGARAASVPLPVGGWEEDEGAGPGVAVPLPETRPLQRAAAAGRADAAHLRRASRELRRWLAAAQAVRE